MKTRTFIDITLFTVMLSSVFISSSKDNDDAPLKEDVSDLQNRVSRLEEFCKEMNTNLPFLNSIIDTIQKHDFITSITPIKCENK